MPGAIIIAALSILVFFLAAAPIWDIDVFWHIKAGEWIAGHAALPSTDIFSAVDPARPWVPFQWLYETIVYAVDVALGLPGIRVLHALIAASSLAILAFWIAASRGMTRGLAALVVTAFLFADRMRTRPDVFNLLFLVLLLPVLTSPRIDRKRGIVVLVIAALWAATHAGGALLLPILLVCRLAGRGAMRGLALPDVLWTAGSLAVMCVVPGFLGGTYQAFFMLGPSERFIPEWMSTIEFLVEHADSLHEWLAGLLPAALLAALLAVELPVLFGRPGDRPAAAASVLMSAAMVGLSLLHVRFLWLGSFPFVMWLLRSGGWPSWWRLGRLRPDVRRVAAVLPVALLLILDVHYHLWVNGRGWTSVSERLARDLEPGFFPEAAAEFLAEAGVAGRILNHAPWGGYLLYRLHPPSTVFTDGRGNFGPVESELLTRLERPSGRKAAIDSTWEAAHFEVIVHPNPFPLFDAEPARWLLVHRDSVSRTYLAADPDNWGNIEAVRSAYERQGLALPPPLQDPWEWRRRIERFLAEREADRPDVKAHLAALCDAARAQGDERSVMAAAAAMFDLGLYREAREWAGLLDSGGPGGSPRAAQLVVLSFAAEGEFASAVQGCRRAEREGPGPAAGPGTRTARADAVLRHVCRYAQQMLHAEGGP
jgi:hypothetical protein